MSNFFKRKNKNKKKFNKKNNKIPCIKPNQFKLDIKINPINRWSHILKIYSKQIRGLIATFVDSEGFKTDFNENDNKTKTFLTDLCNGVLTKLEILGGMDYVNELKGISKFFKDIPMEYILLVHLCYESYCQCTSVVLKDKDSSLYLGRTLDWVDFERLRELTIDIDVYSGNVFLYKFTTFVGYIGCLTSVKWNKFGFAINFRMTSSNKINEMHYQNPNWPIGFLGRYMNEHCNSLNDAIKLWSKEMLMAPVYVTLLNKNKAIQITRDENATLKPLTINITPNEYNEILSDNNIDSNSDIHNIVRENNELKQELNDKIQMLSRKSKKQINNNNSNKNDVQQVPYIVQTNIDHWIYNPNIIKKNKKSKKKPKINDEMESIPRLNVSHKMIKDMKFFNQDKIWEILFAFPIHEKEWTLYSSVINIHKGYYQTFIHIYKD